MKPLIYEPKCIIYEYKSSLFTFFLRFILVVLFDCKSNTNLATPQ